ncbi:hypothetical protein PMAYCL1PPCAC_14148, partial [Pristionchus mayeri]
TFSPLLPVTLPLTLHSVLSHRRIMSQFHLIQQSPPFNVPISIRNWTVDHRCNAAGSLGILKKLDSPDGSQSIMIKKFMNPYKTEERAQLVLRELNCLRTINHSHIARMRGSYTVNDGFDNGISIYHITNYAGKPLIDKIEEGKYSMADVKKWMRELVEALQHLHSNGVIFRNLHPRNICIDNNNNLTLTGFGKARVINRSNVMTKERGTDPYMSIEQQVDWVGPYDEKVDIWSVGAIFCELILGDAIFSGKSIKNFLKLQMEYCGPVPESVLQRMLETDRAPIEQRNAISDRKDFIVILRDRMKNGRTIGVAQLMENEEPLRDFIEHTLQFDPHLRMSAEAALGHHFLRDLRPWERPPTSANNLQFLAASIHQEINACPMFA